jgi:hypothetical protein
VANRSSLLGGVSMPRSFGAVSTANYRSIRVTEIRFPSS